MGVQGRLKDVLEIVGLVAIVASLGLVAYEVRQNTAAVRSSVIQSVSDQSIGAITLVVENTDLREGIDAAVAGTASNKQMRQVNAYYAMLLRVQMNRFLQVEVGAIDKLVITKMGGKATVYDTPAFRRYWGDIKAQQAADFRAYMEKEIFADAILDPSYTSN
jgi:hypothetical protein